MNMRNIGGGFGKMVGEAISSVVGEEALQKKAQGKADKLLDIEAFYDYASTNINNLESMTKGQPQIWR